MAKKKLVEIMTSYGLYDGFDSESESLPKILAFTTQVPAKIGIEFGYILNIKKGRGEKLTFCIEHPPFRNKAGDIEGAFKGEFYVKSSDFDFFLGDTIWAPIEDKLGDWVLTISWQDKILASKKFKIVPDEFSDLHEAFRNRN